MSGATEKLVREWLSTGEAQAMVRQAAKSVLRTAREKRYSFTFIGLGATTLADEALLGEIESELARFILENRRGIQERLMVAGQKAGRVLQYIFLQDWLDATRNRKSDQWRYLYKRTVGALRGSVAVKTKTGNQGLAIGTFYSMAPESVSIQKPTDEELSSIMLPEGMLSSLTFEALNKVDVLFALATHFWHGLSAQHGRKPVWIPVKAFVNWIGAKVPIEGAQRVEARSDDPDPIESVPDNQLGPEALYFDRGEIVRWAEKFSNSLTKKERIAFFLHHGDGFTLAEVAKKLGYSAPSGPVHSIDKAKEKLRRFLRDLPWLSPPDLNEEAWAIFVEKLFSTLKEQEEKP